MRIEVVAVFGIAGMFVIGFAAIPSAKPTFFPGQLVTRVIDNQRGQVIKTLCWNRKHCQYIVRYQAGTQHDYEFELNHIKPGAK